MPRDGFFCPLRPTTVNPAQQHTKDLSVFLVRVARYPELFEEFIDIFRDCCYNVEEDVAGHATAETEVPICVNVSMRCSLMVPDAKKAKEHKIIQLWGPAVRDFLPVSSGATLRFAISIDCLPQAVWKMFFPLSFTMITMQTYTYQIRVLQRFAWFIEIETYHITTILNWNCN